MLGTRVRGTEKSHTLPIHLLSSVCNLCQDLHPTPLQSGGSKMEKKENENGWKGKFATCWGTGGGYASRWERRRREVGAGGGGGVRMGMTPGGDCAGMGPTASRWMGPAALHFTSMAAMGSQEGFDGGALRAEIGGTA